MRVKLAFLDVRLSGTDEKLTGSDIDAALAAIGEDLAGTS